MPYQIGITDHGPVNIYFDYLDGDRKKVTNPDQSPALSRKPPRRGYALVCGRPIDTTHLPTRLRPKLRRQTLPDVMSDALGYIVSDRTREIVEGFDPGIHAFYPLTFVWNTGEPEQTHFLWVFQRALKALSPDGIDPPYPGPNKLYLGHMFAAHPNARYTFSKAAIGDAHAWSDPQLSFKRYISDSLAQAFLDAPLSGFAPQGHVAAV